MFRMFRKNLVVAGASLVLLAAVATPYAQDALDDLELVQTTDNITYATEIFGPGSQTTMLTGASRVTLVVAEGTGVGEGGAGTITFTLTNEATFGAAVSAGNLARTIANGGATATLVAGTGGVGSTTATFALTVTDGSQIAAGDRFVFTLPAITNAHALATPGREIEVTVTTAVTTSTSGVGGDFQPGGVTADETVVARSQQGINLALSDGMAQEIDLRDRNQFEGTANFNRSGEGSLDTRALEASTVALTGVSGIQNVAAGSADIAPDANDRITFEMLSSGFRTNDVVFLDLDEDNISDNGERFSFNATMATATFRGDQPLNGKKIYYVPNGMDDLTPTTFSLSASYMFNEANHQILSADQESAMQSETQFAGLEVRGWALATPQDGSRDEVQIRITNETNENVTVFAQGYGQNGDSLGFIELIDNGLLANETRLVGDDLLREKFCPDWEPADAPLRCWNGRARFDFFTSGNISVQVFQIGDDMNLRNMASSTGIRLVNGRFVR